ncbi:hypothetical protein BKA65DRAFT_557549 [Rhexocercosporidium sp. MPI-PUGE-AT-0058]|nr:hypothetical protein BKA65DRAFT_557549 [Rhexocercosporidium sp. MPI-PUGE-AT-0058]
MARNSKLVVKVAQTKKRTKTYKCEVCLKVFFGSTYPTHLQTAHEEELKDWPCGKCKRRLANITSLRIHQREHEGKKIYSCEECHHHSLTKSNHEIHVRKHTGEKPYSCQSCGCSFANRSDERKHKRRVCEKKHPDGNKLGQDESSQDFDEAATPSPKHDQLCGVCGISDDLNPIPDPNHDELTIFCDSCNKSYHMTCVRLEEIPNRWFCEPCDASLRGEVASSLEEYHQRVCQPCDSRLRDDPAPLLEKSHKPLCETCDANKEIVNRVQDTRHFGAKLFDFFQNLGKEERSKTHDPPGTSTAEESRPTTPMDDATPGSSPDKMPSEGLSGVGEMSFSNRPISWKEQGGVIVNPEPEGELDHQRYWEHDQNHNPPPNDFNTVLSWPTFDNGEGMRLNTGFVGFPSCDQTTQIHFGLDLGLMSGSHKLVPEGHFDCNGFAVHGLDMNFAPRAEVSAAGLRGDIWAGGNGQGPCQPYGWTPDLLESTDGVALVGSYGSGGMPPIAFPSNFANLIEPISNADLREYMLLAEILDNKSLVV